MWPGDYCLKSPNFQVPYRTLWAGLTRPYRQPSHRDSRTVAFEKAKASNIFCNVLISMSSLNLQSRLSIPAKAIDKVQHFGETKINRRTQHPARLLEITFIRHSIPNMADNFFEWKKQQSDTLLGPCAPMRSWYRKKRWVAPSRHRPYHLTDEWWTNKP